MDGPAPQSIVVRDGHLRLAAFLRLPRDAKGLVIFAHGSGSGRHSPRNNRVGEALAAAGYATLLLDLLTPEEERDRRNVFDIDLLAGRLLAAVRWAANEPALRELPVALFGASTGAGAALAAAAASAEVRAVVSRGGRPDLAGPALHSVRVPTLLIVGGNDGVVIDLNRDALEQLAGEKALVIVPGAGHLFEEPGTLAAVVGHAVRWFDAHVGVPPVGAS